MALEQFSADTGVGVAPGERAPNSLSNLTISARRRLYKDLATVQAEAKLIAEMVGVVDARQPDLLAKARPPAAPVARASTGGSSIAALAVFEPFILEASNTFNIPASFIRAIIMVESNGNPRADNHIAQGLMQLTPPTAKHLGVHNPFDPRQNIMGGTKYLAEIARMKGRNWKLIAYSYNAGPYRSHYPFGAENTNYWIKVRGYLGPGADGNNI